MGPKYWNKLPNNLKSIYNINTFKSKLKTAQVFPLLKKGNLDPTIPSN